MRFVFNVAVGGMVISTVYILVRLVFLLLSLFTSFDVGYMASVIVLFVCGFVVAIVGEGRWNNGRR